MDKKNASILSKFSTMVEVNHSLVEGVDYINISPESKTWLGKILTRSHGYIQSVDTMVGRVGNTRIVSDFLSTPGYPLEFLAKSNLNRYDVKRIPKKRKSVPNYWSILTHIIGERILGDKRLLEALKELPDEIIFTSFTTVTSQYEMEPISIRSYDQKIGRYLAIVKMIFCIVKEVHEDDYRKELARLIMAAKDKRTLNVFDGLPFTMNSEPSVYEKMILEQAS